MEEKKFCDEEYTDFYAKLPKDKKPVYKNPGFARHGLDLPMRAVILGMTASGKGILLMEILKRMQKTFSRIIFCVRNIHEPLYEHFIENNPEGVEVYEHGEIPDLEDYSTCVNQILIVFDDLVAEKDQSKIFEWFLRGRKVSQGGKTGASCIYISQTWYKIPLEIRQMCNYVFIKQLNSMHNLAMIMSEFCFNLRNRGVLDSAYQKCMENPLDFMLVHVMKGKITRGFFDELKIEQDLTKKKVGRPKKGGKNIPPLNPPQE